VHQHYWPGPPNHPGPSRLSRAIRVRNRLARKRFRACRLAAGHPFESAAARAALRCLAAFSHARALAAPSGVARRSRGPLARHLVTS
jgi:hypothetical protein